jgi:hypothetical protein
LVTPVPLSPLLLLCCAYGGGSIKISLQAMPYIQYLFMHVVCVNIFVAIVLKPRFKIEVVIMIICSIVIIINSVLTLQVSTAKPMIADLVE